MKELQKSKELKLIKKDFALNKTCDYCKQVLNRRSYLKYGNYLVDVQNSEEYVVGPECVKKLYAKIINSEQPVPDFTKRIKSEGDSEKLDTNNGNPNIDSVNNDSDIYTQCIEILFLRQEKLKEFEGVPYSKLTPLYEKFKRNDELEYSEMKYIENFIQYTNERFPQYSLPKLRQLNACKEVFDFLLEYSTNDFIQSVKKYFEKNHYLSPKQNEKIQSKLRLINNKLKAKKLKAMPLVKFPLDPSKIKEGNKKEGYSEGGEGYIHKLAKEIIAENKRLVISLYSKDNENKTRYFFTLENIRVEERIPAKLKEHIQLDLYADIKTPEFLHRRWNGSIGLEIKHSSKVDAIKKEDIRNLNVAVLELFLDTMPEDTPNIKDELYDLLMETGVKAKYIHNPSYKIDEPDNDILPDNEIAEVEEIINENATVSVPEIQEIKIKSNPNNDSNQQIETFPIKSTLLTEADSGNRSPIFSKKSIMHRIHTLMKNLIMKK